MSWIESINVDEYVKQLMKRENDRISQYTQNKLDQLGTIENGLKTKISYYGQIQNLFDGLQKNIEKLNSSFEPSYDVTSANTAVLNVKIDGIPSAGTHALVVTQLAQAERVASTTTFANNNADLAMTNTLTFTVGSESFNVNVNPGDSLQTVVANINAAAGVNNIGVTAAVVETSANQYQLVVSSTKTGTANEVSIAETGVGANAFNISTGVGGTGTVLNQAQNAEFTLDNLEFNLANNSNLIMGLNITLLDTGSSNITVSEKNEISKVAGVVNDVINSYNQIMTYIAKANLSASAPDAELSLIQMNLKEMMIGSPILTSLNIVPTPHAEVQPVSITLADGSIKTVYPTGLLKVGTDPVTGEELAAKLAAHFSQIKTDLLGEDGLLTNVNKILQPSTGSLWKTLHDTTSGSIPLTNRQIDKLDEQIKNIKTNADDQKKSLLMKYAKLSLVLSDLQVRTQYISAQIQAMSK